MSHYVLVNIFLKNGAHINYETLKNAVVGGHLETGTFSKTGVYGKTGEVRLKHRGYVNAGETVLKRREERKETRVGGRMRRKRRGRKERGVRVAQGRSAELVERQRQCSLCTQPWHNRGTPAETKL